jgi:transcription elongation GreA/GreB family factor
MLIDFQDKPGHAVEPAFAMQHMVFLSEDHILVRLRRDGDLVRSQAKEDPAATLHLILAHSPDHRSTQAEINTILKVIVGEAALKNWWTRAKKMIESDPRIAQPETRTGYYVLRDQPIEQVDELIEGVLFAKPVSKKIQFAEKLLSTKVLEDQKEKLLLIIEELEKLCRSPGTGHGERLQLLWLCEDFAGPISHALPEDFSLEHFIEEADNLTEVANFLSHAQLNRLLRRLRQIQPDSYRTACITLLRGGSARTIGTVVDFFIANGFEDEVLKTLRQWLRDNSLRSNIIDWILRNRLQEKYATLLAPLIGHRLFRLALVSIDQEALRRSSNRKIALAETIAEDQRLVEEALAGQSQELVRDLAHMVLLNQGFDNLTKKSIVARFIRIFPDLQKLLNDGGSSREEGTLKVSQESLDAIRNEYEILVHQKIPTNKIAVGIARDQGDLRENSEYKMARQDQDMLLARKAQIEKDLARMRVVDFASVGNDTVAIGSVVTLIDGKNRKATYAILGAWDSNPERRMLAYLTPMGQILLGKKVGETVEIDGQTQRIDAIERWVDHMGKWPRKTVKE